MNGKGEAEGGGRQGRGERGRETDLRTDWRYFSRIRRVFFSPV